MKQSKQFRNKQFIWSTFSIVVNVWTHFCNMGLAKIDPGYGPVVSFISGFVKQLKKNMDGLTFCFSDSPTGTQFLSELPTYLDQMFSVWCYTAKNVCLFFVRNQNLNAALTDFLSSGPRK